MKKKYFSKKYKTANEMDEALETSSLGGIFREKGVVKTAHVRKINLDLPEGVVRQIDHIAEEVGVSRQPLLKIWIHERLKAETSK